jgi:hypothetical protein
MGPPHYEPCQATVFFARARIFAHRFLAAFAIFARAAADNTRYQGDLAEAKNVQQEAL